MKHACGFCGSTLSFLILQWRTDKEVYELRCGHHTRREWPAVAAVDRDMPPVASVTHRQDGSGR
jgi:hypothetical protein